MYLYHYCSNDTFYKIIHNHELWMTDISRSNDYDEMRLFVPGIFFEVENLYKAKPFEYHYKNENGFNAFQQLLHEIDGLIAEKSARGDLTSYVTCFSEEKDLLSQWRGYADNARGCSLGFLFEGLKEYCDRSDGIISIKKVKYIEKQDLNMILQNKAKELITRLKTLRGDVEKMFKPLKYTEEDIDLMLEGRAYILFKELLFDSLRYKWADYKEENEWRIFFRTITKDEETLYADEKDLPDWRVKYDKCYKTQHNKIEFFANTDSIIPYFPLKLTEISSEPIKTVILGPKNKSYIQDIKLLFAKEKLGKPEIQYSKISYR